MDKPCLSIDDLPMNFHSCHSYVEQPSFQRAYSHRKKYQQELNAAEMI
jgi:hypothetical protein